MFIFYLFGNIWREDISFRIVWLSTLCVCFSTSCFTLVVTSYLLIYLRETVVTIEYCRVLANLLCLLLCFFLAAFFMLPTRELSASDLLSTIALFLLFLLIQLILFVSERIFLCLETSVFITTCLVSKLEPTKEFFLAVAMQVFYSGVLRWNPWEQVLCSLQDRPYWYKFMWFETFPLKTVGRYPLLPQFWNALFETIGSTWFSWTWYRNI